MARVSIIGGRGYTGSELLRCLWQHESFDVAAVASRSQAGELVSSQVEGMQDSEIRFCAYDPDLVLAADVDAYVLALPNGESRQWVAAIDELHPNAVVIDLSADHRTDDRWVYGLPEINRKNIQAAKRIANPGCYATAAILAIWPYRKYLIETPVAFGVSGYSGAGRVSNERNNLEELDENIRPYKSTGHMHQHELRHVLGHDVYLVPHVAGFFRGLLTTVSMRLDASDLDYQQLMDSAFSAEPYVQLSEQAAEPAAVRGRAIAQIGPVVVDESDESHIVVTSALDNLSKGAATQAMQNLNLAFGFSEMEGIPL